MCPDNRLTGGKIYNVRTRDVKSRVAEALRLAKNYFGDLLRRWQVRLGSPKAITTMAHKLARLHNLATALNYHLAQPMT